MRPLLRTSSLLALTFSLTLMASPLYAQQTPGVGPNFETRLSSLEEEIRALNGQVEQIGYSVKRMDGALQRIQADYDARLTKLEADQAAAQAAAAAAQQAQQQAQAAAAAQAAAQAAATQAAQQTPPATTKAATATKQTAAADTPADNSQTPQEQYERAFGILRNADYPGAEKSFKTFIEKNPKDKLIDNAKYWYGESLYVQNKYNEAAIAFVDAYQQNTKGTKAPDSLLKLALSLNGLNKKEEACATLSELKSKYPQASASVRARTSEELTKLKCSN